MDDPRYAAALDAYAGSVVNDLLVAIADAMTDAPPMHTQEHPIEVVSSRGDRAFANDPESALAAARQLREDDFNAMPVQGRDTGHTFAFFVNGEHVRTVEARDIR